MHSAERPTACVLLSVSRAARFLGERNLTEGIARSAISSHRSGRHPRYLRQKDEDDMVGHSRRRSWAGPVVVGLAIAGVAIARAAIPDASGVIHACYRSNGNLRVVDNPACKKNETALAWNQTGPQGLPGPQGQPGVSGPAGPAGVSGYEIINNLGTLPLNGTVAVIATCSAGKRVIGGGYVVPSVLDTAPLSRPEGNNAWRVDFKSNGGSGDASVYAICAAAS
jgi:hypothetical protein